MPIRPVPLRAVPSPGPGRAVPGRPVAQLYVGVGGGVYRRDVARLLQSPVNLALCLISDLFGYTQYSHRYVLLEIIVMRIC